MPQHTPTLGDYLSVLRSRLWLIVFAAVLLAAAAATYALAQPRLYQASAEVLVNRQSVASALAGSVNPYTKADADRLLQTQAKLAASEEVASRTLVALGIDELSPNGLLRHTVVKPVPNTDLLRFSVSHRNPVSAKLLATAFARQFTLWRAEIDSAPLIAARERLEAELHGLDLSRETDRRRFGRLSEAIERLRQLESAGVGITQLVQPAVTAHEVAASPVSYAALGFAIGLLLGAVAAFVAEAVDTRVRSGEELGHVLSLPVVTHVPASPRRIRNQRAIASLEEPGGTEAESYRVLRTNIEFFTLEHDAHVLMVTSALPREGKSTVAANLAVSFARAGRRVAIADLDLRVPSLDKFFTSSANATGSDLASHPGVSDVVLGNAALGDALIRIPLPIRRGNHEESAPGTLDLLVAGAPELDPGEFVESPWLAELIERLGERFDIVIVDTPPMLGGSDAMAVSAHVEGILVVMRGTRLRLRLAEELASRIARSPARSFGVVAVGQEAHAFYSKDTMRLQQDSAVR